LRLNPLPPRPSLVDEQAQVARASDGDRDAMDRLVASHLPYVIHIAKEFRDRGVPFEDVVSEGCLGLMKAVRRYRAANGTRFMTYATFWVRKEILQAMATLQHTIQIPRYARRNGHERARMAWLDSPGAADGALRLADRLRHPDPPPTERVIQDEQTQLLHRSVRHLEPRERVVIAWRYGLHGKTPKTLKEIAGSMGLSRERVRQIEVAALARLRHGVERESRRSA
jgi:RNA polymerase sigma factor (sigma-70 family)